MKQFVLLVCLIFFAEEGKAQNAVVANLKMNVAYIGIPNPLSILAKGNKKIEVYTDNGTIEKSESSYSYYPKTAGQANIILRSKTGYTVAIARFIIRYLPDPAAVLMDSDGGKIKKSRFLLYPGIHAELNNFDICVRFKIQTFSIAILRGDTAIFVRNNYKGTLFSDELKQEFRKTIQGDKLIFYGITCQGPDLKIRNLAPIEFIITE